MNTSTMSPSAMKKNKTAPILDVYESNDIITEEVEVSAPITTQPTQSVTQSEFFDINLGHKSVYARKWKSKDRKNFKKILRESENVDKSVKEALVLNCLEDKNVALNVDEIQYILIELRKRSISKDFTFKYVCNECETNNTQKIKIDDVNNFNIKPWEDINGIKFGNIPNAKFYKENFDEDDDTKEMAFYIKSINGDNTLRFEDVVAYLDDMDISDFDVIYEQFLECVFTINNYHKVKCSKCGDEQTYEFDEIAGFFPDTWLK